MADVLVRLRLGEKVLATTTIRQVAHLMDTTEPTVLGWLIGISDPPKGYVVEYAHVVADPMYGKHGTTGSVLEGMRKRRALETGENERFEV